MAEYTPIHPAIEDDNALAKTAIAVPSPRENQPRTITTNDVDFKIEPDPGQPFGTKDFIFCLPPSLIYDTKLCAL